MEAVNSRRCAVRGFFWDAVSVISVNTENIPAFNVLFWFVLAAVAIARTAPIGLAEVLVALGPLVIVPLGLRLLLQPDRFGNFSRIQRLLFAVTPNLGLLAAISFLLPVGPVAALLTVPWLLFSLLLAAVSLGSLLQPPRLRVEELCSTAAGLYLPVGAVALVMSRYGITMMHFSHLIILLTVAHFHFAAFAAPLVVSSLGRALRYRGAALPITYVYASLAFALLPAVLGLAITFHVQTEVFAALALGTAELLFCVLQFQFARKLSWSPARVLLSISAASGILAALFIFPYAVGTWRGEMYVLMQTMIRTHGVLNALGFALCGLIGWILLAPQPSWRRGIKFHPFEGTGTRNLANWFNAQRQCNGVTECRGVVDDFAELETPDFNTRIVSKPVAQLYHSMCEFQFRLRVRYHFPLSRAAVRFVHYLTGQFNFAPTERGEAITSTTLAGCIEGARACLRTYESGVSAYLAAYGIHHTDELTYLNVAFPLPMGHMTVILRPRNRDNGGMHMSSIQASLDGDEGTWYVFQGFSFRLPMQHEITLSATSEGGVRACHRAYFLRIPFMTLEYDISKRI